MVRHIQLGGWHIKYPVVRDTLAVIELCPHWLRRTDRFCSLRKAVSSFFVLNFQIAQGGVRVAYRPVKTMKQPTELLTFSSLPIGCELDDFPPLELPICYRIILSCAAVFMYDIALWPVFSEKPTEYL